MSREEVSVLSSARREEVRRQAEEAERLRANPLLYLVSPHVKVRWQLIVIQLINKLLASMTDTCKFITEPFTLPYLYRTTTTPYIS
jgi:hypothetical protein